MLIVRRSAICRICVWFFFLKGCWNHLWTSDDPSALLDVMRIQPQLPNHENLLRADQGPTASGASSWTLPVVCWLGHGGGCWSLIGASMANGPTSCYWTSTPRVLSMVRPLQRSCTCTKICLPWRFCLLYLCAVCLKITILEWIGKNWNKILLEIWN